MPSSEPIQRFSDIIEAIERFTAGMDLQRFAEAEQTIRTIKYGLPMISEAAAKLGDMAGELCPAVPWRTSGASATGFGTTTRVSIWSAAGCRWNATCRDRRRDRGSLGGVSCRGTA